MASADAEVLRKTVMEVMVKLGFDKEQEPKRDVIDDVTTVMAALLVSYKLGGDRVSAIHREERKRFNPSLN
jgi:hypothetical protein